MKVSPTTIAMLVALVPVGLPAQHQRMEDIGFPGFWAKFKRALSANDKAQIASMTKFPFPYHVYGGNHLSKTEFIRRYDEIFDPVTRRCFSGAKTRPMESSRPGFVGYEVYCNSSIYTFEKLEGTYRFSEKYPDD